MRSVVVLNQYALPRTEGGGTRHIDLFSRTPDWQPLIVTGNRSHYTQEVFRVKDDRFRAVWVPRQSGGAVARLLGWVIYAVAAFMVTVTKRDLDLVYGSSPQPLAPLAGLAAARLRGVPFVLEVRDLWPESAVAAGHLSERGLTAKVFRRLERLLAVNAAFVVCVTRGWEGHFEQLGVRHERLVVVPNGTEPDDFKVSCAKDDLRIRHRIRGFTAVFAGAHGPSNGIDLVLDAAAALADVNFLFIGAGPVKAAAVARAQREGLVNVTFRDPVAKVDLAEVLTACDVGVHSVVALSVLDKGMSPNKLFDYMAAGLPIVSNAEVGLRHILQDDECGRVGGVDSLPENVRAVHTSTAAEYERWSLASQAIVRSRFSSRQCALAQLCLEPGAVNRHRSNLRPDSGASASPRVVHVTTAHTSTDNRILRKECVSLAEAGIDIFLLAVADEDRIESGVHIVALPRHRGRLTRALLGSGDVWRALRKLRPAMIHVHDPELIPLAALWRLVHGKAAVFDSHEDLPKQVVGKTYIPTHLRFAVARLARMLEVLADRTLDGVVAATPAIARNFRHAPVTLVQNFPWLRDFPEPIGDVIEHERAVCYVGGITKERGGLHMITAVGQSSLSPILKLAGPASSGMHKALTEAGGRVRYLGVLPPGSIPEVIQNSLAGLVILEPLPNYLDSQPTKLFEYMAAARPFIASDFASWRLLLNDYDCGIFVDPAIVGDLASAIDWVISEPKLAREMGARGREAMMRHFTFENERNRLITMTKSLVTR